MNPMPSAALPIASLLLACLAGPAAAQSCGNFRAYEFNISANDSVSAFGIGDGPDRKVKQAGGYAADLSLSQAMVDDIAASLAAGCTQRVDHPGFSASIWTWNLGKAKAAGSTTLTGNAISRGKAWKFGEWPIALIHQGVQDEFYTVSDGGPLSAVLPADKLAKMKPGDSLVFSGALTVLGESTTGGLYDQGSASGGWKPYVPFFYIFLP